MSNYLHIKYRVALNVFQFVKYKINFNTYSKNLNKLFDSYSEIRYEEINKVSSNVILPNEKCIALCNNPNLRKYLSLSWKGGWYFPRLFSLFEQKKSHLHKVILEQWILNNVLVVTFLRQHHLSHELRKLKSISQSSNDRWGEQRSKNSKTYQISLNYINFFTEL